MIDLLSFIFQECIRKTLGQKHIGNRQKILWTIFMGYMAILRTNHNRKTTIQIIQEASTSIDGLHPIQLCMSTLNCTDILKFVICTVYYVNIN